MPRVIFRNALDTGSEQFALWVNGSTGNDNNTIAQVRAGAGSVAWQTIGRAAWGSTNRAAPNTSEAAAAGDVVAIAAGTYSSDVVINDRFSPVYNPANSGTLGNPIRFVANGTVTLAAPYANAPVIGAQSKNYIEWYADVSAGHSWQILCDGRESQNPTPAGTVNTAPDTGPVVFNVATGGSIEGADIDGGVQIDYTDNWIGVRLENVSGVTVKNNVIHDFMTLSSGSSNAAGMELYGVTNGLIEHNEIYAVTTGIYFKDKVTTDPHSGTVVRYNNIHDIRGNGIAISFVKDENSSVTRIYQNLIRDAFGLFSLTRADGVSNTWVYNNTGYNLTTGWTGSAVGTGSRFWNNIVHTAQYGIWSDGSAGPSATNLDMEHNVFYNATVRFYDCTDGDKTIAQWRTDYPGQDADPPQSITIDPLFVSAGTDFTLQAGSPARDLGVNVDTAAATHAGCYIIGSEVIGPEG